MPREGPPAPPTGAATGRTGNVRRDTLVASMTGLVSGALNAAILAVSARSGQTGEIAAYTVMTAALAWVCVIVVGGSSLLYVSGTEAERDAVRSQRILIAVPAMVLATGGVAITYTTRGYDAGALVMVAVVAIANSFFELQSGDLVRQMRFLAGAVAVSASRLVALAFVVAGTRFTTALAVVSVVQFVVLEMLLCRGAGARRPLWAALSLRAAVATFRMNRQLFVYNTAEVFTGRAAGLALSLVAPAAVVGCFGALYSVYQAIVAVLYSGLRVPMVIRTRRRHGLSGHSGHPGRESETISVAAATLLAAGLIVAAPWITTRLLLLPLPGAALWLQLLALALPFLTMNRAISMNRIGDGDYRGATAVAVLIAGLTAVALLGQLPGLDATGAAGTAAFAEILTLVILMVRRVSRRRRRDPQMAAVVPGLSDPIAR
ncbi:hypothetical protein [Micromonospora halophytica]|nr:hypothetical protein [Micromonospora halophytica]